MYLGPAPKVPYNRNRHTLELPLVLGLLRRLDDRLGRPPHGHNSLGHEGGLAGVGQRGGWTLHRTGQLPDTGRFVDQYPNTRVSPWSTGCASPMPITSEGRPNGITFYGTNGTIGSMRQLGGFPCSFDPPFTPDMDRVEAQVKTGNVAWPVGWDRNRKIEPVARCKAARQEGIRIDPAAQEAHVRNFLGLRPLSQAAGLGRCRNRTPVGDRMSHRSHRVSTGAHGALGRQAGSVPRRRRSAGNGNQEVP